MSDGERARQRFVRRWECACAARLSLSAHSPCHNTVTDQIRLWHLNLIFKLNYKIFKRYNNNVYLSVDAWLTLTDSTAAGHSQFNTYRYAQVTHILFSPNCVKVETYTMVILTLFICGSGRDLNSGSQGPAPALSWPGFPCAWLLNAALNRY